MGSLLGVSESARSLSSAFVHQTLLLQPIHSNLTGLEGRVAASTAGATFSHQPSPNHDDRRDRNDLLGPKKGKIIAVPPLGGTAGCELRRAGKPKSSVTESDRGKRSNRWLEVSASMLIRSTLIARVIISTMIRIETTITWSARRTTRLKPSIPCPGRSTRWPSNFIPGKEAVIEDTIGSDSFS